MNETFISIMGEPMNPGDWCIAGDRYNTCLSVYRGKTPSGYYSFGTVQSYTLYRTQEISYSSSTFLYRTPHHAPKVYPIDDPPSFIPPDIPAEEFFRLCAESFRAFRRKADRR